jgi:hypothetical protein
MQNTSKNNNIQHNIKKIINKKDKKLIQVNKFKRKSIIIKRKVLGIYYNKRN